MNVIRSPKTDVADGIPKLRPRCADRPGADGGGEQEAQRGGDRQRQPAPRAPAADPAHGLPVAQAIAGIRRIPRPFVVAPRSPVRDSAAFVPYVTGITGTSSRTTACAAS